MVNKIKFSEEHKKKLSIAHIGKKRSLKTKNKISKTCKELGVGKWNKGRVATESTKRKMSEVAKKNKFGKWMIGKKLSESHKKNISKAFKLLKIIPPHYIGENHPCWRGGKSFEPYSINWTRTLKTAIKQRDNYTCQICNQHGNMVHHIDYDKKNCNLNNLITLCNSCHAKTNQNRDYWIKHLHVN